MSLGELIAALEAADPRLVLPHGFHNPHSYRGYYEQLAFEPAQNVTVADMLNDARSALGTVYQGYKGGSYRMVDYTECWLAEHGCCSEDMLGPRLIGYMIAAGRVPAAPEPEPDPASPHQIAVSLMNDAARDLDPSDIWDAIAKHHPNMSDLETGQLVQKIGELAETADMIIGWPEVTT